MRKHFLFLLICSLFTFTAAASSEPADVRQVVRLFDAVASYPAPSWIDDKMAQSDKLLEMSEFNRKQEQNEFILEQIPKGESFSNWTKLYAVFAVKIPASAGFSLEGFVNGSLAPFIQSCGRPNFTIQPLERTGEKMVTLVFCQNSPRAQEGTGYGEGIGEIGLFHFQKVKDTYVKVYHEWKGKNFSLEDQSGWPIKVEKLRDIADRFRTISISEHKG